jgi:hypothetical protein
MANKTVRGITGDTIRCRCNRLGADRNHERTVSARPLTSFPSGSADGIPWVHLLEPVFGSLAGRGGRSYSDELSKVYFLELTVLVTRQ